MYLCFRSLCILTALQVPHVCSLRQFEDRSRRPVRSLEFLSLGSMNWKERKLLPRKELQYLIILVINNFNVSVEWGHTSFFQRDEVGVSFPLNKSFISKKIMELFCCGSKTTINFGRCQTCWKGLKDSLWPTFSLILGLMLKMLALLPLYSGKLTPIYVKETNNSINKTNCYKSSND